MVENCPDRKTLFKVASNRLPADEAAGLLRHIDSCKTCQAIFAEIQQEENLAGDLRQALGLDHTAEVRDRLAELTEGEYEILDELGRGAGSLVFQAIQKNLDKRVAIKCLVSGTDKLRQVSLCDEARAMARIRHPAVGEIYTFSENPDLPYLVMEYVDGRPLTEWAEGKPRMEVLERFRQVLSGVEALHKKGMVHRDLKPGNILADASGAVKVLDLGIARDAGPAPYYSRDSRGTPAYIAPEQSYGQQPEPSMDIFALGVLLFELLTGERPFSGNTTREIIEAVRQKQPPLPRSLNAAIPGPLQAICLTALEKEPSLRYPTAREFRLDLERFFQGEAVAADPTLLEDILEHGVSRHLSDLKRWQEDHLITTRELDFFAGKYDRLRQREAFWVLDSRQISFSQITLHLGAWGCIVSTLLMFCFSWEHLSKTARISLPLGTFALLTGFGLFLWRRRTRRIALVLLLGSALTLPLLVSTTLVTMTWFPPLVPTPDGPASTDLIIGYMSNLQLLISCAAWCLLSLLFWRKTKTTAFSLVTGLSLLALAIAVFSFLGLRELMETGEWGLVFRGFLIPGAVFMAIALWFDLRQRNPALAVPFYVLGMTVLLFCLTCTALFGPTTDWLGLEGHIENQDDRVAFSFIVTGAAYLLFGLLADRSRKSRWLRRIAVILFWLTPTHMLAPVAYFALEEKWLWSVLPETWTISELVLPLGALFFVITSVPKQMKSFFFSGLFYIALSVVWLTHHHFTNRFTWPLSLALCGLGLLLAAWRWPALFEKRRSA